MYETQSGWFESEAIVMGLVLFDCEGPGKPVFPLGTTADQFEDRWMELVCVRFLYR